MAIPSYLQTSHYLLPLLTYAALATGLGRFSLSYPMT